MLASEPRTRLFVVITVDVEDAQARPGPDETADAELATMIYGRADGQCFGVPKIMEICERFGMRGSFFVSVFDVARYGEAAMSTLCAMIRKRGHDVELHTHPFRAAARVLPLMTSYSVDEQTELVARGKALLHAWLGEEPRAHRAGSYGANEATLTALRRNAIAMDSSQFYAHPNSEVRWSRNRVVERDGLLEIPVTTFVRRHRLRAHGIPLGSRRSAVKTDINWASGDDLRWFVQSAKERGIRVVTLFLHSYSLINFDSSYTSCRPDPDAIAKFENFLSQLAADPEIHVATCRELWSAWVRDPTSIAGSDDVPERLGEDVRIGWRAAAAGALARMRRRVGRR